jgi:DHA2 family multidrug resistance protein-like MFS transporter
MIVGLVVTGTGLGLAMSVASTAIIGNAPVHRAGMASSVEEVSYEFGNLTAVAILGSMVTAVYAATIDLPAGAPDAARESLATAVSLAGQDNPALIDAASAAFDTGYVIVMAVVALIVAIGAGITGVLLRRAPVVAAADTVGATH